MPSTAPPTARYVRLGLQLGRHVEGAVDAYFGPAELAAAVAAAPPVEPAALVADAEALLGELEDGWLRDQVVGVRSFAGVLAGEAPAFADEAEACYGVRPTRTDEAVFAAAHARLDELLDGDGPLHERYQRYRQATLVPGDRLERTLTAVIEAARAWTGGLVELPAGEGVDVQIVRDEPWMAYCGYGGGLRSTIEVNADLPQSAMELLRLAIHETYPGHHTERACKEAALVRGAGRLEETIVLVPTPQSLIAEGIAVLATSLLLESDGGPALAAVLHDHGIELDLAHALAVDAAREPLRAAEVNAALLLHADGAPDAEVQAYLERWALIDAGLAAHVVRFLHDPGSRTYLVTYALGEQVCQAYVGRDRTRFRRLLCEQVRVGELLASGG